MFFNSANRDERAFERPFDFDITRSPNPHVGYGGGGPHFCLGANLARREIRVMFEELFRRLPDLEITGEPATPAVELHPRHQAHALRLHPGWVTTGSARCSAGRDLLDARERGDHVLARLLRAHPRERLGHRGLLRDVPALADDAAAVDRLDLVAPDPTGDELARSPWDHASATRCAGSPRTRSPCSPSRTAPRSSSTCRTSSRAPVAAAAPRASRTVPDPSMSRCRRGSTRRSKIASGGAEITRSTVTTSASSVTARMLTILALRTIHDDTGPRGRGGTMRGS